MGWMPDIPHDQAEPKGTLNPRAIVLHRTYGQWAGDYAVIKRDSLCQFLIGKLDGQWVQFMDTTSVAYHCNGANFMAVGVELTGINDDPLSDWQISQLNEVLTYLHDLHHIPLSYLNPIMTKPASIWVNGGGYQGVIAHLNVKTDNNTAQHTDYVSALDYSRVIADPLPIPPKKAMADNIMWLAFMKDINYCDVYYAGVLVDGFTNEDPNQFGIGPKMQRYLDQGVPSTMFDTEAAYAGSRARLKKVYQ